MLRKIQQFAAAANARYTAASPAQKHRLTAAAALVCVLGYRSASLRATGLVLWLTGNTVYALAAVVWGGFHPRSVMKGWQTALQWAVAWAFASSIGLLSVFETLTPSNTQLPYSLFVIAVLLLFPVLFGGFAGLSLLGAALGAYAYRRRPLPECEAARFGVTVGWVFVLMLLAALFAEDFAEKHVSRAFRPRSPDSFFPITPLSFLSSGFSVFILLGIAWILRVQNVPYPLSKRLGRRLSRLLVRTVRFRKRTFMVHLRGALLGLIAAGLIWAANVASLLEPLQTSVLASMLKLGDAANVRRGDPQKADEPKTQAPLVILEMDRSLKRDALSVSSECEIQAKMIRELIKYGAKRVVLPLPTLDPKNLRWSNRFEQAQYQGEVKRAAETRHLQALCSIIRKAGNVIVATVPVRSPNAAVQLPHPLTADERKITEAALASVSLTQETFGATHLVCLQVGQQVGQKDTSTNAAPLLLAAMKEGTGDETLNAPNSEATLSGDRFPLALNRRIVVHFGTLDLEQKILHLSYSDVQHGEDLLRQVADAKPGKSGPEWETTGYACKNKIVFLDALIRDPQETFLGRISSVEAVAHTTEALYSHRVIERVPPAALLVLTFLLSIVGAHFTFRRNPFDAAWQLAAPLLPTIATSFLMLIVKELWLDVVPLTLSLILTYMLVVQSGYSSERDERERNRVLLKRFVAPQVIEKYLDEPELLGLGGVKQQVCVIFVDVRNFTGFAESRDPQEVIEAINDYMTGLTGTLRAANGILDKYTGDGLMAFFPLHDGENGSVSHALETAIEMQRVALRISQKRAEKGKAVLNLGIGVHSGEAVTGLVGSEELSNYTAMGLTVVVSARLQSIAGGGEVVISETVHAVASQIIPFDTAIVLGEPIKVKGVTELIAPYRLSFPAEPSS